MEDKIKQLTARADRAEDLIRRLVEEGNRLLSLVSEAALYKQYGVYDQWNAIVAEWRKGQIIGTKGAGDD